VYWWGVRRATNLLIRAAGPHLFTYRSVTSPVNHSGLSAPDQGAGQGARWAVGPTRERDHPNNLLSIYAQNHLIQSDGREQSATVTHGGAAISKSIHINLALEVLVAIFQLEMRNPPQLASETAA
jgi:hypothetical protein